MVSFVNFARIASICVGFHLGTLHGYFFHQDFWPNLNFLLECQLKLVLRIHVLYYVNQDGKSSTCSYATHVTQSQIYAARKSNC